MPACSGSGLLYGKRYLRLMVEHIVAPILSEVLARNIKGGGGKPVLTLVVTYTCLLASANAATDRKGRLLVTVSHVHGCHLSHHMFLAGLRDSKPNRPVI